MLTSSHGFFGAASDLTRRRSLRMGPVLVLVLLASCRNDRSSTPPVNTAPSVTAGPDQRVIRGAQVSLMAIGVDPEGDPLAYTWAQIGGSPVQIAGASSANATFVAPSPPSTEDLTFVVTASDGTNSVDDTVIVTVEVPATILAGPTIVPNPNPLVPQAAIVSVETDIPAQVELAFDDGVLKWTELADADFATAHPRVPVLGMRHGNTVEISVTLRTQDGIETVAPQALSFTPPALPSLFPDLILFGSAPSAMEPGVTFFSTFRVASSPGGYLIAVDAQGEVVWYLDGDRDPVTAGHNLFANRMPNGNLLMLAGTEQLVEMDLLGDIVQIWYANGVKNQPPAGATLVSTDSFHHDVWPLPAGSDADFAVLSSESRQFANYPASETDPTQTNPTADVVGDVLVEFKRDGTVVREVRLLDVLDPFRVSYDSLGDFWNNLYSGETEDWAHGNGFAYDQSDDSYIISFRHQDAVVKIARQTGELIWILGDPGRWVAPWADKLLMPVLTAGFEWPFHQHNPSLTPSGTVMMFDNGNNRVLPPDTPLSFDASYSRVAEYSVDTTLGTVEQAWTLGGIADPTHPFYSSFVSGAMALPAGNVLVADGARRLTAQGLFFGRIVEVTHTMPPGMVFELVIGDLSATRSYVIYRAERRPSVYPR